MTSTPTPETAFLAVLSGTAVFLLILLGDSLVTAYGAWARDRVTRARASNARHPDRSHP